MMPLSVTSTIDDGPGIVRRHFDAPIFGILGIRRRTAAFLSKAAVRGNGLHRNRFASVARDGIEPPTRGFSVRCSTN